MTESSETPDLLVLYQELGTCIPHQEQRARSFVVLSFTDQKRGEQFAEECTRGGLRVAELLNASDYVDQVSKVTREKYVRFVGEWPDSFVKRGKSFKELFAYRDELSYWWLSNASFKDNEISPTFEYLCHLEIVRESLRTSGARRCVLITTDRTMARLVTALCQHDGISTTIVGRLRGGPDFSWARGLAGRFRSILILLLGFALGSTLLRRAPKGDGQRRVAFLTVYPDSLRLAPTGPSESNYRDLPQRILDGAGVPTTYLAVHHSSTIRGWLRLLTLKCRRPEGQHPSVVSLSSYLSPGDIWLAVTNLLFYLRYLWMDLTDRDFRRSFSYDGIDVFDLMGREWRRWFLGSQVPFYLAMARATERAVKSLGISHVVCFLELYPLARAVYYGAKRGNPAVTTVAYQHANINSMKLWYAYRPAELVSRAGSGGGTTSTMPIPDRYLFQGQNGMKVLLESGYPEDRCHVTGSPRYDVLGDIVSQGPGISMSAGGAREDGKTRVLVTPSLSRQDARELIEVVAHASERSPEWEVLVKPHPLCPVDEYVNAVTNRANGGMSIRVVEDDLHQLIRRADVVVTSYSTAGDEAIALGRPVVCYAGLRPCGATFVDIPAAPVVRSAEGLAGAVQRLLNDSDHLRRYQSRWPELVMGSFYMLDGRATERAVDVILAK